MKEGTRKGLVPQIPQITQMDADEEFWSRRERNRDRKFRFLNSVFSACSCSNHFAVSASILATYYVVNVNLRAIPDSVAAGPLAIMGIIPSFPTPQPPSITYSTKLLYFMISSVLDCLYPRVLAMFAENRLKCLSMNILRS